MTILASKYLLEVLESSRAQQRRRGVSTVWYCMICVFFYNLTQFVKWNCHIFFCIFWVVQRNIVLEALYFSEYLIMLLWVNFPNIRSNPIYCQFEKFAKRNFWAWIWHLFWLGTGNEWVVLKRETFSSGTHVCYTHGTHCFEPYKVNNIHTGLNPTASRKISKVVLLMISFVAQP